MEDQIANDPKRSVAALMIVGNRVTEAEGAEHQRGGNKGKEQPPQPVGGEAEPWPQLSTALLCYQHILTIA